MSGSVESVRKDPVQRNHSLHSISSLVISGHFPPSNVTDSGKADESKTVQKVSKYPKQLTEIRSNSLSMVREESLNSSNNNTSTSHSSTGKVSKGRMPTDDTSTDDDLIDDNQENSFIIKMRKIPCLGVIMAFISGIFFATAGFTVCLIPNIDATVIVVFRSIVQIIFYLPAAIYSKDNLFGVKGERSAIIQRSIFGFICFTLSYYALAFLSLSDASAIAFSAPVYVSIFACVLLKEPCGSFQVITIIVTIVGVILISRPTFIFHDDISSSYDSNGTMTDVGNKFTPESRLIGVILSFLTAITMAYTFIAMRRLQKTPVAVVINFFSFFCVTCGLIVILIMNLGLNYNQGKQWLPLTGWDYGWMIANGFCGVGGQLFLVLSLKLEEAGLVSLARTFDIVMAFIYQVAFLHQQVYITSIVGAIIVCSGVIACALKKTYGAKPEIFDPIVKCINVLGFSFKTSRELDEEDCYFDETIYDSNYVDHGANYNHAFDHGEDGKNISKIITNAVANAISGSGSSNLEAIKEGETVTVKPTGTIKTLPQGSKFIRQSSLTNEKISDGDDGMISYHRNKKQRATSVPTIPDTVQITTTVKVTVVNSPMKDDGKRASGMDGRKQSVKSARKFSRSSSVVSEIIPTPY